ncbi:MAG: hypothetical protein SH850_08710 [Planctomycetaceae bacterium]|nr:hypothetical protein [Planctomycetaceae bacterium]
MEYQLKPPGKTCAASGQPLVPGSVCHSVVVERQGQLVRLDYSSDHWAGPPADAVGHWTAQVPAPKYGTQTKVDPDALMRFFEQLCEEQSPNQDEQRYVSALLLLKLKKLRLNDVRHDEEAAWLLLEGTHGEGNYEVRNLELSDADTGRLQQALKAQLATEWC